MAVVRPMPCAAPVIMATRRAVICAFPAAERKSSDALQPADQPSGGDVHRKAFEGERQKTEIAGDGHLENFVMPQNRENIEPLRARPIVPKFPQPTARSPRNDGRPRRRLIGSRRKRKPSHTRTNK